MQHVPKRAAAIFSGLIVAGLTASALAFDTVGADIAHGKEIYNGTCVACHGANGKGTVPGAPDFTKKGSPLFKSDDTLFDHTKNGFRSPGSPLAMPSKGGNTELKDQDIKDVIGYIHKAFKKR